MSKVTPLFGEINFNYYLRFLLFWLAFWPKMDNFWENFARYICCCIPKKWLSNIQGLGPPCRNFQICKNSLLLLKKNSSKIWFRARLLNFNIFREAISCEIRTRINLLNFTLVVKKWRVKSFFPSLSYTYKQPCHPFFKCFNCEILWFRAMNYAFQN